MVLQARQSGDVIVLEIEGRLDAAEAPGLSDWLENNIQAETARVVINLTGVRFVDSSGLAVLVKGLKRCRQYDGNLHLCGLQTAVQMIFEITRLDLVCDIFATEAEALAAFAS